jgi:plasmid stabilization system protein ParE
VQRFPYVIYYRLVGQEIRVAAILHHRRGQKARDRRLPVRQ